MKNIIIVLVLLVACGLCSIISAVSWSDIVENQSPSVTPIAKSVITPTASPTVVPTVKKLKRLEEEYRQAFIDGCTGGSSASVELCNCMIDALEEDLGADRIIQGSMEYDSTGEMPDDFTKSMMKCF